MSKVMFSDWVFSHLHVTNVNVILNEVLLLLEQILDVPASLQASIS